MEIKEKIEEILEIHSLKKTKTRENILEVMLSCNKPISAEEIYEKINEKKDVNIDKSTIYRNINTFEKYNIVRKAIDSVDEKALYEIEKSNHTHYIVCINCKKIEPLKICLMENKNKEIEENTGYEVLAHDLKFIGLCDKCKKK